jgi:hypothetical protein
MTTLAQALASRAAGILWREAAWEALSAGRRFHIIPR